jgi:acyl-CoA oxidase
VFRKEDKWFLGRSEEYRRALERNAHIIRKVVELQLSPDEAKTFATIVGELLPISGLHHAMFVPTLQGYVEYHLLPSCSPVFCSFHFFIAPKDRRRRSSKKSGSPKPCDMTL